MQHNIVENVSRSQNFVQQLKLPAKPLIRVGLRLDLALLEDVLEAVRVRLRYFWKSMVTLQRSETVSRRPVAAIGRHSCA